MVRALAGGGAVRVIAVSAGPAADLTAAKHGLRPPAARLAAEALLATAMMSTWIKGDERISLQIQSQEPPFSFLGEIDADGNVRARATPPDLGPTSALRGLMLAIKADGASEIYRGITAIEGTSLAEALQRHLAESTQVDVFLRIDVGVGEDGRTEAGAILVERLPESEDLPSMSADAFLAAFGSLRDTPAMDTLVALAFGKVAGTDVRILEDRPLQWACRCSLVKVENVLASLGLDEIRAMQAEGGAEVICQFCATPYRVGVERLGELALRTA
jgi:molecular chaperone Hsp33